MERFTLKIKLGNDAMQTPADVAAALRRLAGSLESAQGSEWHLDAGTVRDRNGNTVGSWDAD